MGAGSKWTMDGPRDRNGTTGTGKGLKISYIEMVQRLYCLLLHERGVEAAGSLTAEGSQSRSKGPGMGEGRSSGRRAGPRRLRRDAIRVGGPLVWVQCKMPMREDDVKFGGQRGE